MKIFCRSAIIFLAASRVRIGAAGNSGPMLSNTPYNNHQEFPIVADSRLHYIVRSG